MNQEFQATQKQNERVFYKGKLLHFQTYRSALQTAEVEYTIDIKDETLEKFKNFSPDIILMHINIDGRNKGMNLQRKK